MSYPHFEDLTPTTITLLGEYDKPIDLRIAFENLEIVEEPTISLMNTVSRNKKVKFPFIEEIGIISLRLKDSYKIDGEGHYQGKDYSWQCRGMPGNAPFSNSLAFDASIKNGDLTKNISGKLFPGGKILLNGFLDIKIAEDFAQDLLEDLITCGACDEETTLGWFDSQTINYRYYIGYKVNLVELGRILHEANLLKGYDNLSASNDIEIIIKSNADKSHLKTKKDPVQKIIIHKSGKVLQNGPVLDEIKDGYNMIMDFLDIYIDKIKIDSSEPCLSTLEERILDVLNESSLTSHEITKMIGVFKKTEINTGIHQLISSGKIKIVGVDCYEKK